ncbi:hypothetical protein D3C59_32950 [Streptomyces sp. SHP22-7]|nr:hypothetical protein D3C59_32950 [Streptomyces sp. SHP22-7]
MHTLGELAAVVVFADDREVEAGVHGADGRALLGGVPGEPVHAVAEADGLAFGLLDPHGQEFVFGPVPQEGLHPVGHGGLGIRGVIGGLVAGAGDGDLLLAAEDVREDRIDEHRRVAELAAVAGFGPVTEFGEFRGLVLVVGGEELVRGEPAFVLRGTQVAAASGKARR